MERKGRAVPTVDRNVPGSAYGGGRLGPEAYEEMLIANLNNGNGI